MSGNVLGGSVDLDIHGTPSLKGPVAYTVTKARLDNLSMSNGDTQFTGNLSGHLEGPSLGEVSGQLGVTSSAAMVNGHVLAPIRFDADVDNGKAVIQLVSGIWQSRVEALGWVRPFDSRPAFAVEGFFDGMDVSPIVQAVQRSTLDGHFNASGNGRDMMAVLELTPSTVNNLAIENAAVTLAAEDQQASTTLTMNSDQGVINIRGDVVLGDTVRFTLEEASWSELDVAALLGLDIKGRSTGRAAFSGLVEGDVVSGQGALFVWDSQVGPAAVEQLESTVVLGSNRLSTAFSSRVARSEVEGSIDASWSEASNPTWRVEARFNGVDASTLGSQIRTDLTGDLVATGYDNEPRQVDLVIADSRINEQPLDSAWIAVSYNDGAWPIAAGIDWRGGQVRLNGEASQESVMARELSFAGLDLGAVLGSDGLETRLNGTVSGLGVSLGDTMQAAGILNLSASSVNEQAIDTAYADIQYSGGSAQASANVDLGSGSIRLDTLRFLTAEGAPDWSLQASAQDADLSGLGLPPGKLNGKLDIAGTGIESNDLAVHLGHVELDGSVLGDWEISKLRSDVSWEDGVLTVDTLDTRSNALRLNGSGGIVLSGTQEAVFAAGGALLDAGPLASLTGIGELSSGHQSGDTLWLNARSNADGVFLAGRVVQTGGTFDDLRWLDLDADVSGRWVRGAPPAGRLSAAVSRLSVPGVSAQSTFLDLALQDDTLAFAGSVNIDSRRSARLRGFADLQQKKVLAERVSLDLDQDRWHLDQETTVSFAEGVRFRNLLLTADDQEIALDGILNFGGQQTLGLTVYDFRLGSVADLLGYDGIDGVLNGSVRLRGPAEAPEIRGSLDLVLESLGTMTGSANYAEGQVQVDASLADLKAGTLELAGTVPADLRLRRDSTVVGSQEMRLAAEADDFGVHWIAPWLDEEVIGSVGGTLTGSIGIAGTPDTPDLSGAAAYSEGEIHLPMLGISVTDIEADIRLEGDTAFVTHVGATSGGTLTGTGTIGIEALALGEMALNATLDRFLAADNRESSSHVTGDIEVRGTLSAPEVTGTVRLTATDIHPTQAGSEAALGLVAFTEADLQMLERHFNIRATEADTATFDLYEALSMNVDVIIGDDVWLRARQNPEMHVLLTGVVGLTKEPYQEPQIQGTVQAVPVRSYIRQFGRRFDIQTGRVTFVGPATDPLLDFRASYEVTQRGGGQDAVTIIMDVEGSLHGSDGLELELSSEPISLDQADIISYIATGRPAADAFQLAGTGTLQVGGDLARQQLAQLIAAAAGAGLGLDVVEIQMEGSRGATITAGKYVSRRLFASVSLPLSASEDSGAADSRSNRELTIEYSIFAWLLARLRSNPSTMGVSLLYQYVY